MIYLSLYWEFLKIGLFSVGGGLATLPFLQELSDRMGWFTQADLSNMIAVSESTPGPIGINMATYAGYSTAGIFGGIVATLGLITPAIVIIMLVAKILSKFKENKYVSGAFYGLRAVSMALIASAGLGVMKLSLLDIEAFKASGNILDLFIFKAIILGIVIFIGQKIFKKLHPVVFIAFSAVVGIIFNFSS